MRPRMADFRGRKDGFTGWKKDAFARQIAALDRDKGGKRLLGLPTPLPSWDQGGSIHTENIFRNIFGHSDNSDFKTQGTKILFD